MDNNIYTKNMFIESCLELRIGLAKDLTEIIITDAYNTLLNEHTSAILKGTKPLFEIHEIDRARNFLLNSIKAKK